MQGNATIDAARSWFDMIAKTPPQAGLANEHATPRTLDTNDQTADQRATAEGLKATQDPTLEQADATRLGDHQPKR